MMTLRYRNAALTLLALTMTTVDAAPPENESLAAKPGDVNAAVDSKSHLDDPAFDRFVHHRALAEAWTDLDAAGMVDGALQTLEAERVLGRSKPHLSAQLLFTLTMRLALEQNDHESLDRLNRAATQANRPELVTALLIAQKTAGPSRAGKDIAPVTPQDTDVPTFRAYRAFLHDIQAARLCGDARALDSITSDLEGVSQFTELQRESLLAQIKDAGAEADVATDLPDALNRLVSKSRGIQFQGVYTHWSSTPQSGDLSHLSNAESSPRPQQRRSAATGPALGQYAPESKATNRPMSYEARQAGLELLRNPKGIKPSLAGQRRPQ